MTLAPSSSDYPNAPEPLEVSASGDAATIENRQTVDFSAGET
jgi:hypothetical protein